MMKKYTYLVLVAGMGLPIASLANPMSSAYTRTVTKTFQVNEGARLRIDNKYGKIDLRTWDNNQIRAVVTITTAASTDQAAQELASQVDIQTSQSGSTVSLATQYSGSTSGSFWKRFFGVSGSQGRSSVHIDYEVMIPRSLAATDISNNYGDVAGSDLPGNVDVRLNYGHFHLSKIAGKLALSVNYCEGSLAGIANGVISGNYTNFQLDNVRNVKIQSNYSDYKIATGTGLTMSANYGSFSADRLSGISSQSNYTDYKIGTLGGTSSLNTTYGDIRIQTLAQDFGGLNLRGTYGNASVGIPASLPVRLDIRLTRGDIHASGLEMSDVEKTSDHGSNTLKALVHGSASAPLISVNSTYSDVTLTGE